MPVALELSKHARVAPASFVREEGEADAPEAVELRRRDLELRPRRHLAVRMVGPADQPDRAQQRQRELAPVHELVFHDVVEEDCDASGVDEAVGREGRQRHLAVPALRLEASLDHGELPFRGRRRRRLAERNVEPHPVIGARIHERHLQPAEGLTGAQLDRGRDLDGNPLPAIAAHDHEPSTDRTGLDELDANTLGTLDQGVVLGRRVVVGVAAVAAGHDPADSAQRADVEGAVFPDRHGEQAVVELMLSRSHGVFDLPAAIDGSERDPAERRYAHVGDDSVADGLRRGQGAVRQLERGRRGVLELDEPDPRLR